MDELDAEGPAGADAARPARLVRDAVRRLFLAHAMLDEVRRPCGTELPVPHAWALLELRERGPLTVTALSERLNIDRTNVSRLCARMEALGEVRRGAHPDDGRAWLITLTVAGERAASAVDAASCGRFAEVVSRLAVAPGDLVGVLDALSLAMVASGTADGEASR